MADAGVAGAVQRRAVRHSLVAAVLVLLPLVLRPPVLEPHFDLFRFAGGEMRSIFLVSER